MPGSHPVSYVVNVSLYAIRFLCVQNANGFGWYLGTAPMPPAFTIDEG